MDGGTGLGGREGGGCWRSRGEANLATSGVSHRSQSAAFVHLDYREEAAGATGVQELGIFPCGTSQMRPEGEKSESGSSVPARPILFTNSRVNASRICSSFVVTGPTRESGGCVEGGAPHASHPAHPQAGMRLTPHQRRQLEKTNSLSSTFLSPASSDPQMRGGEEGRERRHNSQIARRGRAGAAATGAPLPTPTCRQRGDAARWGHQAGRGRGGAGRGDRASNTLGRGLGSPR
ncbi:hypothetical protein O3P69_015076 [Scylla paramamosain]|uniref:Uncharacterized protein n=1 Tax=Scylla paramamosain TaxID=85552 RepID=A0AAW0T2W0_SCYPA